MKSISFCDWKKKHMWAQFDVRDKINIDLYNFHSKNVLVVAVYCVWIQSLVCVRACVRQWAKSVTWSRDYLPNVSWERTCMRAQSALTAYGNILAGCFHDFQFSFIPAVNNHLCVRPRWLSYLMLEKTVVTNFISLKAFLRNVYWNAWL